MVEKYYFGSTPPDAKCTQVGTPGYEVIALKESNVYVKHIQRFLESEGHPVASYPKSFQIKVESQPHDLGSYYEVVCTFDFNDPEFDKCHKLALLIDWNVPSEWDAQALAELTG